MQAILKKSLGGGSPLISEVVTITGNWNANAGNASNGSYTVPADRKCIGIQEITGSSNGYLKTLKFTERKISMTGILSNTGNFSVSFKYQYK